MKWEVLNEIKNVKNEKDIVKQLLLNKGLKTKKEIDEFINPRNPKDIKIEELGITKSSLQSVLKRLETAKNNKEKIVIFGDYDADGVCATAILWEALHKLGFDVMPYIPDRFEEGYGIKESSFSNPNFTKFKPSLVVTVDNGIVAFDGVAEAKKRKIDVIVVDHHTKVEKKLNTKYILHSTLVCGSALSWFLAKELGVNDSLDLATIGTIADQMQLTGINRSVVKFGLDELLKTKRVGLKAIFTESGIKSVGTYEIGYIVAPRINAMGRLSSAIEALRLLCTRDERRAKELSKLLSETNIKRQKIVDDVLTKTLKEVKSEENLIVIDGDYHEGVIGLASGRVTEKFYKPSIIISRQEKISKASARSINGFNIIEAIKETKLILEGGGHPMAAGFSIETERIEEFRSKINDLTKELLTDEILERKLKIDLEIDFKDINKDLVEDLKKFEPTGYGNFSPIFCSRNVKVVESKTVGNDGKHLKMKLEKDGIKFDGIWFGYANDVLKEGKLIDIAYNIEENVWNSKTLIQLKVKDIYSLD